MNRQCWSQDGGGIIKGNTALSTLVVTIPLLVGPEVSLLKVTVPAFHWLELLLPLLPWTSPEVVIEPEEARTLKVSPVMFQFSASLKMNPPAE